MFHLLLLLLFILFIIVVLIYIKKPGTTRYNLPPSPLKLPFIGNMHQIIYSHLHRTLRSLSQKHGPLMLLHLFSKPALVVSSPDMARAVMKTYDHVFSSRPELAIPKRLTYGKDIAFSPYGEEWRQVRKLCVLEVLTAKKVQSFRAIREEEVALIVDKIEEAPLGLNLSEIFVTLLKNIVSRATLGKKYGEGEGGGRKFKELFDEFSYLVGVSNIEDLVPSLGWLNYVNGLNARVEKNFRSLDSFLDEVIGERLLNKKKRISGCEEEEDIVDIMLRNEEDSTLGFPVTRDATKAMVLDMFIAGTETLSMVLEWAMSELIKHPEIMVEAQKEVRGVAKGKRILNETDMENMHILKSIIKETLRLHPPLPLLILRESMKDVKVEGYHIPAKTTIMINAFAIGRDPMWWEESEKFWPTRFLNGNSTSVDFKGHDFQFIPFGAGRRGCPGILFATSTLELTMANLLNRFDWIMPNGLDAKDLDMHECSGMASHRKFDLILIAEPHYKIIS